MQYLRYSEGITESWITPYLLQMFIELRRVVAECLLHPSDENGIQRHGY